MKYTQEPVQISREHSSRYGGVEGLDDSELANPEELERQVYLDEYGPILALPVKNKWHGPRPEIDESGQLDFGAFASVDFKRMEPQFDIRRYKLEKLKEELQHSTIMVDMVKNRIPGTKKYLVMKYLKLGCLDLEHISDMNLWALGKHYLRFLRLKREIAQLQK